VGGRKGGSQGEGKAKLGWGNGERKGWGLKAYSPSVVRKTRGAGQLLYSPSSLLPWFSKRTGKRKRRGSKRKSAWDRGKSVSRVWGVDKRVDDSRIDITLWCKKIRVVSRKIKVSFREVQYLPFKTRKGLNGAEVWETVKRG